MAALLGPTPALFRKSRQTGVINLEGMELKRVPKEIVHPFDYLEAGESSQYVVLLTRLNLQDNGMNSDLALCIMCNYLFSSSRNFRVTT